MLDKLSERLTDWPGQKNRLISIRQKLKSFQVKYETPITAKHLIVTSLTCSGSRLWRNVTNMWESLVMNSRLDAIACICASPMICELVVFVSVYIPCSFFSRFLDVY